MGQVRIKLTKRLLESHADTADTVSRQRLVSAISDQNMKYAGLNNNVMQLELSVAASLAAMVTRSRMFGPSPLPFAFAAATAS